MRKTLLVFSLIASSILVMACQPKGLTQYTTEEYSFQHPTEYSIEEKMDGSAPYLLVQTENGKLEIFKTGDFSGVRMHGFSSSGLEEFEAQLVPKEKLTSGEFEFWLFYPKEDEKTQAGLHDIVRSFVSYN